MTNFAFLHTTIHISISIVLIQQITLELSVVELIAGGGHRPACIYCLFCFKLFICFVLNCIFISFKYVADCFVFYGYVFLWLLFFKAVLFLKLLEMWSFSMCLGNISFCRSGSFLIINKASLIAWIKHKKTSWCRSDEDNRYNP